MKVIFTHTWVTWGTLNGILKWHLSSFLLCWPEDRISSAWTKPCWWYLCWCQPPIQTLYKWHFGPGCRDKKSNHEQLAHFIRCINLTWQTLFDTAYPGSRDWRISSYQHQSLWPIIVCDLCILERSWIVFRMSICLSKVIGSSRLSAVMYSTMKRKHQAGEERLCNVLQSVASAWNSLGSWKTRGEGFDRATGVAGSCSTKRAYGRGAVQVRPRLFGFRSELVVLRSLIPPFHNDFQPGKHPLFLICERMVWMSS